MVVDVAVDKGTVGVDDGTMKLTSSSPSFVAAMAAELPTSPIFDLFLFGDNRFLLNDDERSVWAILSSWEGTEGSLADRFALTALGGGEGNFGALKTGPLGKADWLPHLESGELCPEACDDGLADVTL